MIMRTELNNALRAGHEALVNIARLTDPFRTTPSLERKRYNVDKAILGLPEGMTMPLPPASKPHKYYTLVSSELYDGGHKAVLDIDFEATLVPSTTEGHYHLYLDGMESLSWREYKRLLKALTRAGIITKGYYDHSVRRRQTLVRRPGLRKTRAELVRKSSYETLDVELDF